MRRLALSVFSSVFLVGCPGGLNNCEDFDACGGGAGGSPGRSVEAVFQLRCGNAICHDSDEPAADLDLVSPDVASRTMGLNSTDANCGTDVIVIAGDPDESYMLKKILNEPGICGGQMPIGTILDAEDTDVIRNWIIDLGGGSAIVNQGPDGGV